MKLDRKVVVITGPTASGKTNLSIELAKMFKGEIISADSRAVYKGIDIASAKPNLEERQGIIHWGFDLVYPNQRFTAADFQKYTYEKIDDIISRGKIPIIVGGTGLYIDAVLRNYKFGADVNSEQRNTLNLKSLAELKEYCRNNNIKLPENENNKRYLIRQIENKDNTSEYRENSNNNKYIVVGITTPKNILKQRINDRAEQFFNSGVIEETVVNSDKFGWESEAMTTNAYRIIKEFLDNNISYEDMIEKYKTTDWRLAKRQLTFMKRNQEINWLPLAEAKDFIIRNLRTDS